MTHDYFTLILVIDEELVPFAAQKEELRKRIQNHIEAIGLHVEYNPLVYTMKIYNLTGADKNWLLHELNTRFGSKVESIYSEKQRKGASH